MCDMASKTKVEIEGWEREQHFSFFNAFEEPFFGLTANVECTGLYTEAKQRQHSFYLRYMHAVMAVVNTIDALKFRIEAGDLYHYDRIDVSATVLRTNHTFGFSYIPFHEDLKQFAEAAKREIERVRASHDLLPSNGQDNVIHFSAIPWIKFTSVSHARPFSRADSCPKISVGKLFKDRGRWFLPVAFHAHHALADGYHAGQFYQRLEAALNAT
ncbi:chloramphenicol acetyltransferase [Aliidiomarina halalkaliphila]|uniref:Chloramphenicol acetyltransferase n=2 Tax=Aliidiomarina halalkaliphila TaxID=2593535 RepID=A0A552X0L1_9GAMM|nr:chloramphenicol acetyltransferase [Aliidiomarina halalkaliphila]